MTQPFLGEIRMFAGNFAPRGWAFCNGQLLSIAQNTAVFSLLGTTYGGDGQTTFGLPDLRGRVPVHPGQGPGLSSYTAGQTGGVENVTLTTANLPTHTHGLTATDSGQTESPANARFAVAKAASPVSAVSTYATTSNATLSDTSTTAAGSSQPHTNIQPTLALNYIIALEGVFPSRN